MNKTLNLSLCQGRHEIPQAVDGSVFRHEISSRLMTNEDMLEECAFSGIWEAAYKHHKAGEQGYLHSDPATWELDGDRLSLVPGLHINLYVTGLTVALIATLNVCKSEGLTVTLYHFNRDTGEYFAQEVK